MRTRFSWPSLVVLTSLAVWTTACGDGASVRPADIGAEIAASLAKGDAVLVYGSLVRRFYRSGAGARSLTEVVASGVKRLEAEERSEEHTSELQSH